MGTTLPWDCGVRWHLEQDADGAPAYEPLTLAFVRDDHLKLTNGTLEDAKVTRLIKTARRWAEGLTWRSFVRQRWTWVADQCPDEEIQVPRPPLLAVESFTYLDLAGVQQTWGGSPLPYDVSAPVGPNAPHGRIRPAYGESWPSTRSHMEAVRVTYLAGYAEVGSPAESGVPDDILDGMLLVIGELYKQRSESVHAFNQNPALIRARDLCMRYRAY